MTSDLVVAETLVGIGRLSKDLAVYVGGVILGSKRIETLRPVVAHEEEALRFLKKYQDQERLNFVDCVSFALMRASGISTAFTFDRRDFEPAGFSVIP